jgi:superfamily II DNA/RNA helicase
VHISAEIERRMLSLARRRMAGAGRPVEDQEIERILESIQNRFFDRADSPGRAALDRALEAMLQRRRADFDNAQVSADQQAQLVDVMRRFLRVPTTLVRCFPIHQHDSLEPHLAVRSILDTEDESGLSWRSKFAGFIDYLLDCCSSTERADSLQAASRTQTGGIRVEAGDEDDDSDGAKTGVTTLANVQVATGTTRRDARSRLMRAFNTPFFPDILVCSQVMGEGVDLQRSCRHVIHHDLAWNPSSIEQRTGRVDRLGCKAENRLPICVYLPYIAGTADERQYKVMSDREHWFRIVMGQEEVAKLIPTDSEHVLPSLPEAVERDLSFHLSLERK